MTNHQDGFDSLAGYVNVSRETFDKLEIYQQQLIKWNPKINLVSKSTIATVWLRHILDSVQIWPHAPKFDKWVDIGSGAGFPGMVIAILARELSPGSEIHLVESDARKCAFLRNVSRETNTKVTVHTSRIENLDEGRFDVVSARALASADKLLNYADKLLRPAGKCLFLKGAQCDNELQDANKNWDFQLERFPSLIAENSSILRIGGINRVERI